MGLFTNCFSGISQTIEGGGQRRIQIWPKSVPKPFDEQADHVQTILWNLKFCSGTIIFFFTKYTKKIVGVDKSKTTNEEELPLGLFSVLKKVVKRVGWCS